MLDIGNFEFGECETIVADARKLVVPKNMTSASSLFDFFFEELELPGFFGNNWNSLLDCLRDLSWIKEKTIVVCHSDWPPLPQNELRSYVEVLSAAIADWKAGEAHSIRVVFPAGCERVASVISA